MIFTRIAVPALVAVGLVSVLGPGRPDPGVGIVARQLVHERAVEADAALAELQSELGASLDDARTGAARTASGEIEPGPSLTAAADRLDGAADVTERADRAVRALGAAAVAADRAATPIHASVPPADIAAIATELRTLAASANGFAELRMRAEGLNALLADALEAVEAGDLAAADAGLRRARDDHDALAAWDSGLASLPVWLETSEQLLAATEDLAEAVRTGDAGGAAAAAARVAALEEDAVFADRALRIAMSEGAAYVADGPVARLAAAERLTGEIRVQVESILQAVDR